MNDQPTVDHLQHIATLWGLAIAGLLIGLAGVAHARYRYRRWRERTHGHCDKTITELTNQLSEAKHELALAQRDYLNSLTRETR